MSARLPINSEGKKQISDAEKNIRLFRTTADPKTQSSNVYQINIFFDGTSNNGEHPATDEVPTNVYNLYKKIPDSEKNRSFYTKGIGAPSDKPADKVKEYELDGLKQGFVLGDDRRQLNDAWINYQRIAKEFLARDPQAIIVVNTIGFSRGATVGREFVNMVDQFGIPEVGLEEKSISKLVQGSPRNYYQTLFYQQPINNSYLRKPGDVKQNVLLYDTVPTGMDVVKDANHRDQRFMYQKSGKPPFRMGMPASVVSGAQFIAQDEMRDDNFGVWSIKKSPDDMHDFRLLEIALPGVHADIGGSYKTGPSKMYQYLSEIFLSKVGALPETMISAKPDMPQKTNQSRWLDLAKLYRLDGRTSPVDPNRARPVTYVNNSYPAREDFYSLIPIHSRYAEIQNQPYRKGEFFVDMSFNQRMGIDGDTVTFDSIALPLATTLNTVADTISDTFASMKSHAKFLIDSGPQSQSQQSTITPAAATNNTKSGPPEIKQLGEKLKLIHKEQAAAEQNQEITKINQGPK